MAPRVKLALKMADTTRDNSRSLHDLAATGDDKALSAMLVGDVDVNLTDMVRLTKGTSLNLLIDLFLASCSERQDSSYNGCFQRTPYSGRIDSLAMGACLYHSI